METIFSHNPSSDVLEELGVLETNEHDYLNRLRQSGQDVSVYVLFDLSSYFSYMGNDKETKRIDALLDDKGIFDSFFNE